MFKGEGVTFKGVDPVLRRLQALLNSMIRQFGPCVVVDDVVDRSFCSQDVVVFNKHIIRLVRTKDLTQSEVALDFESFKLTEMGREISMGFVVAFGNDITRVISDLNGKKASLYAILD